MGPTSNLGQTIAHVYSSIPAHAPQLRTIAGSHVKPHVPPIRNNLGPGPVKLPHLNIKTKELPPLTNDFFSAGVDGGKGSAVDCINEFIVDEQILNRC